MNLIYGKANLGRMKHSFNISTCVPTFTFNVDGHGPVAVAVAQTHERSVNFITLDSWGSGCVAQLIEQSLPIPEVRGSNPVIGKNLFVGR